MATIRAPPPAAVPVPVIKVPLKELRAVNQRLLGDKIILAFESLTSAFQARAWITAYNLTARYPIDFHEELANAWFCCRILTCDVDRAKQHLLSAASPLKALERFASVNVYPEAFDPRQPEDFTHLVTVCITHGSPVLFAHLRAIVAPIGQLIRHSIEEGTENHRITALVETKLRSFPPTVEFPLERCTVLIHLDYSGRNLRCLHCFSYHHCAAQCPLRDELQRAQSHCAPGAAIAEMASAGSGCTHSGKSPMVPGVPNTATPKGMTDYIKAHSRNTRILSDQLPIHSSRGLSHHWDGSLPSPGDTPAGSVAQLSKQGMDSAPRLQNGLSFDKGRQNRQAAQVEKTQWKSFSPVTEKGLLPTPSTPPLVHPQRLPRLKTKAQWKRKSSPVEGHSLSRNPMLQDSSTVEEEAASPPPIDRSAR